ncbi:phage-associated protein, BcepMu gp16 family [Rhizobium sp. RU35A]|uniref:DNA-binding protein n=1 Tax=Rhizobium sp. RU35A TaxID=1907414 RepID=UPI000955A581|nr:DNA-binding protein [Rhizobium sp. RU35A]SIQ78194.1 phage-associated protein, BcepMu gp16 family [Rhizobium sp. RU35A]
MISNREDVKRQFECAGISIREWAERRGYNPRTVYAVLNGSLGGKRGVSHRIAVDLGLKEESPSTIPGLKAA